MNLSASSIYFRRVAKLDYPPTIRAEHERSTVNKNRYKIVVYVSPPHPTSAHPLSLYQMAKHRVTLIAEYVNIRIDYYDSY